MVRSGDETYERLAAERQVAEAERDRWAEQSPAPVLRTPREEVEAYILSADRCLVVVPYAGAEARARAIAGAQRWLDNALGVLRDENVVDGAALLEAKVDKALDLAEEGEIAAAAAVLEEVQGLLRRRTRYTGEIRMRRDTSVSDARHAKRDAVRAVLQRHFTEFGAMAMARSEPSDAASGVSDQALDELIAAAETGI